MAVFFRTDTHRRRGGVVSRAKWLSGAGRRLNDGLSCVRRSFEKSRRVGGASATVGLFCWSSELSSVFCSADFFAPVFCLLSSEPTLQFRARSGSECASAGQASRADRGKFVGQLIKTGAAMHRLAGATGRGCRICWAAMHRLAGATGRRNLKHEVQARPEACFWAAMHRLAGATGRGQSACAARARAA